MNELFKKREVDFLIQLIVLSLVLFGSHNYLNHHFAIDIILFFPLWHIYVFHVITVLAIYTLINYRASIGKTDVFNAFISFLLAFFNMIYMEDLKLYFIKYCSYDPK